MEVWTGHAVTESADHYIFVYAFTPEVEDVIRSVFNAEGAADMDYYRDTTSVYINKTEVIK